MDNSLPQTVGIDISKATLDVFAHPAGCSAQFTNTVRGHKDLIVWLGQWQVDRIAFEATGAYHRQLELALADLPCVKLNPARARRFAQAAGTLAKTDKIDAVILARMATALQPPVRTATTPQQARLAELISARDSLVRDKIALQNQAKNLTLPPLRAWLLSPVNRDNGKGAALSKEEGPMSDARYTCPPLLRHATIQI